MHQAPQSERVELVRYKTAEMHLAYAGAALDMAEREKEFGNPLFFRETVWTAFFVNYAKPFKQVRSSAKGFGLRLLNDIVPPEQMMVHESIIKMRDKHFAHTDLELPSNPMAFEPEDILTVIVTKNGGVSFGLGSLIPSESSVAAYKALVISIMDKLAYRSNKIINRWAHHLKIAPNTMWTVNLSAASNNVLSRIRKEPKL